MLGRSRDRLQGPGRERAGTDLIDHPAPGSDADQLTSRLGRRRESDGHRISLERSAFELHAAYLAAGC